MPSRSKDILGHDTIDGEPLRIVVVGAGIGGLTAALALRQQGHHVTILESSKFSNETGAAIHMAPNCNGLLKRLGLDLRSIGANTLTGLAQFTPTGQTIMFAELSKANEIWQHEWLLVHRAHLHSALREKATSNNGQGKPAELRLSCRVVKVDSAKATVTLEGGETIQGDLVLGADGVHSQCRSAFSLGKEYSPFDCGDSAFRWLIPKEELLSNPVTRDLVEKEGFLYMIMAEDRRMVWYPCVDNTLINFLLIHPSSETRTEGAGWNQRGDRKQLLKAGDIFADKYKELLKTAPEDSLKVWTLLDMKPLETWVTGKLALLGDAAHPFLPHQAQGGAQAIEDAVSIAAVLPFGTHPEDIAERMRLYQECRKTRADTIQQFTRLSGRSPKELKALGERLEPIRFNVYNFGHDEWDASCHALKKHVLSKHAYRYRQPLSFGPAPGPRQPLGAPMDALSYSKQNQDVYTIRFKTSRTFLQTLFPTSQFTFTSPGTVAQASIICCSLKNMTWLGDTGYNHCGLYIHGVTYTKKNGEKVGGTFMPMLWENLTDPIVTGRDEIAAPKMGCDIDISTSDPVNSVKLSWRGTVFLEMHIDTKERFEDVVPKPTPDDGILLYRYVPAVGEPGKADAEYAVFDPYNPDEWDGTTKKGASSLNGSHSTPPGPPSFPPSFSASAPEYKGNSKLTISAGSWNTLPTFHNVTRELANIPIYNILEAKVEHVDKVGDVRGARRIYE